MVEVPLNGVFVALWLCRALARLTAKIPLCAHSQSQSPSPPVTVRHDVEDLVMATKAVYTNLQCLMERPVYFLSHLMASRGNGGAGHP